MTRDSATADNGKGASLNKNGNAPGPDSTKTVLKHRSRRIEINAEGIQILGSGGQIQKEILWESLERIKTVFANGSFFVLMQGKGAWDKTVSLSFRLKSWRGKWPEEFVRELEERLRPNFDYTVPSDLGFGRNLWEETKKQPELLPPKRGLKGLIIVYSIVAVLTIVWLWGLKWLTVGFDSELMILGYVFVPVLAVLIWTARLLFKRKAMEKEGRWTE